MIQNCTIYYNFSEKPRLRYRSSGVDDVPPPPSYTSAMGLPHRPSTPLPATPARAPRRPAAAAGSAQTG